MNQHEKTLVDSSYSILNITNGADFIQGPGPAKGGPRPLCMQGPPDSLY